MTFKKIIEIYVLLAGARRHDVPGVPSLPLSFENQKTKMQSKANSFLGDFNSWPTQIFYAHDVPKNIPCKKYLAYVLKPNTFSLTVFNLYLNPFTIPMKFDRVCLYEVPLYQGNTCNLATHRNYGNASPPWPFPRCGRIIR